jgi:MFS transporter, DHA1 family, multidrug resistance protein
MVLPNAAALALADHPRTAGSASALLGLTQFATGALAAPLAGVAGSHTALPMAIVMATLPLAGLACLFGLAGRDRTAVGAAPSAVARPSPRSATERAGLR